MPIPERTCVTNELLGSADMSLVTGKAVNGANVIKAAAGDKAARRRISAGHDPRGAQRDGMDFVSGEGVPHNELAVLRCGNEVLVVRRPMHGVDLGKVTSQEAARPECGAAEGADILGDLRVRREWTGLKKGCVC